MVSDNIFDFLLAHRTLGVVTAGVCAFVSLSLIARLWVLHRRARVIPKIVWSVVLLIPVFGWLCFAAFYTPPEALGWTGHTEHGRDAGLIGDGHL